MSIENQMPSQFNLMSFAGTPEVGGREYETFTTQEPRRASDPLSVADDIEAQRVARDAYIEDILLKGRSWAAE